MATNSYKQTTVFGNFQALGYGDRIWPDVELQNWQRVENGLLAMNIENYLITRGAYTVDPGTPSSGFVTLSTSGLQSAFEGSINGSYFKISDAITWSIPKLIDNKTYFLYIREVTGQIDPTSIDSIDTDVFDYELLTRSDKKNRLLMASVSYTITNGVVILEQNPSGQLTANGFLSHITDSLNPHGNVLTQETLNATTSAITTLNATTSTVITENVTTLNADTANVTTLNVGGKQIYTEHIYNETFTCGTDKIVNMRTILSLPSETVISVKFVQICLTGFGATPTDGYFLWVEYDANSDSAQFTIKTVGTTAYAMTAKILVKYVVTL